MSNVLFGGKVSASKPLAIEANEEAHLHITHAALAPAKDGKAKKGDGNAAPAATVLSVTIGGEQFVLATFRSGQVEQCELNLPLHAATGKTYYLNVEGAGEVHVTGVYEAVQDDFEGSDDGFGDFDEEDSDEMDLDDGSSDSDDGLTTSHVKVEEVKDSESESESDKKPAGKQAGKKDKQQPQQAQQQGKKDKQGKEKEKKEEKKDKDEKKQQQSGKESKKRAEPEGGKSSEQPAKKAKGEGAFKCAPCDRAFDTQKALDQHNQSKHKSS